MAMQEWKSFDVMSVAKMGAVIGAVSGFISGLFMAFTPSFSVMGNAVYVGGGLLSPIAGLVGGAIFGAIGGAICAFVYNYAVPYIGGVKVETK